MNIKFLKQKSLVLCRMPNPAGLRFPSFRLQHIQNFEIKPQICQTSQIHQLSSLAILSVLQIP